MITENTETVLSIAGKLLDEKNKATKKVLKSRHWIRIESAIEKAAKSYKMPIRPPLDASDLARFALELGTKNLAGIGKRIGEKVAQRIIDEAINYLDEEK